MVSGSDAQSGKEIVHNSPRKGLGIKGHVEDGIHGDDRGQREKDEGDPLDLIEDIVKLDRGKGLFAGEDTLNEGGATLMVRHGRHRQGDVHTYSCANERQYTYDGVILPITMLEYNYWGGTLASHVATEWSRGHPRILRRSAEWRRRELLERKIHC